MFSVSAKLGVDANALVEHEALARVMLAAAIFEVFQNPAVQLENLLEALALHVRPGLFAANAARAKHHDRLLLEFGRQLADGRGKIAEVIDARASRRS